LTTLLGKEPVTIERRSGDYVGIDFVVSSTSTFPAILALQPMPGRLLTKLPEGARAEHTKGAWAEPDEPELRTAETPGVVPDIVIRSNGERYEVHKAEDWTTHDTGLPHRAYLLVKEEADE
jgi:hypothetical protein